MLPKQVFIQKRTVDKMAKTKEDLERLLTTFQSFMIKLRIFKYLPSSNELISDFFSLINNSETQQPITDIYRILVQHGLLTDNNDIYAYRSEEPSREPTEAEILDMIEIYKKRSSKYSDQIKKKSVDINDLELQFQSLM